MYEREREMKRDIFAFAVERDHSINRIPLIVLMAGEEKGQRIKRM